MNEQGIAGYTGENVQDIINAIHGGAGRYQMEEDRFVPLFYSDGVPALAGYTREEYDDIVRWDVFNSVYEPDRERIRAKAFAAAKGGEPLDVYYRTRNKAGELIWIHLSGRRADPESTQFCAVFIGMSAETHPLKEIVNETADAVYVIDKDSLELLYVNEAKSFFTSGRNCMGQKCFAALFGKSEPCPFCTLKTHAPDGKNHTLAVDDTERAYVTRFKEINWNGIPAYVRYVHDVTEEVAARREKERLELYFKTVVDNLQGGFSVARCESNGSMVLEYISHGLATLTRRTEEEANGLYGKDIYACLHPDDMAENREQVREYVKLGMGRCEFPVRLKCKDGEYLWVKCALSLCRDQDGVCRIYSVYTDISKIMEEKEQLHRKYEETLLMHYRKPDPNQLVLGHCNITKNEILVIMDHTDSDLLNKFGNIREDFFTGLSGLVVDAQERRTFLEMYLNAPALEAFYRNETERILNCSINLPNESLGRYVEFKMNLLETPDSGDVTGVLTVTDITEQTISDRILHQLSVTGYDYVVDLDLAQDMFRVLSRNKDADYYPPPDGKYSERIDYFIRDVVVPKDQEKFCNAMSLENIRQRLREEPSYTVAYTLRTAQGDLLTKNVTISVIDQRLERVCLVSSDITASVRDEQSFLNTIAYTFESMGILHVSSEKYIIYTRETVLKNLSPHIVAHYEEKVEAFARSYAVSEEYENILGRFRIRALLQGLSEHPGGYDFVFPFQTEAGQLFKQVNILWGDENHSTICVVQSDVTETMVAERKAKEALEKALAIAEKANEAKSDFLSSMSHDIRTPMNAIVGMTTLALAHLDSQERVKDCLNKISVSSKHLLSLINDILDISKIENSQIPLRHTPFSLPEQIRQISAIILPQAEEAGLRYRVYADEIYEAAFYGDPLRINQVLINLLSNAVKFTPEGGRVNFLVEELAAAKKTGHVRFRFTVSDTGIGISKKFLSNIYEPFARGRNAPRIEGTGLGLSIVKALINLMDGDISVESRESEGTIFRVELEFERAATEEYPSNTQDGNAGLAGIDVFAGRNFLIAEDTAINAEILAELLEMEGAKSTVMPDGAQAVRAFSGAPPETYDAILMDIQMPVMNGYEATRAIRLLERPDAKTIPIVAMTANAFAEDIAASLHSGMNDHVAKPIDMDILRTALSKLLTRPGGGACDA